MSPQDAVIIVGVAMGVMGLAAPKRIISWQGLHVGTLVTVGVIIAFIGLTLKVVLG